MKTIERIPPCQRTTMAVSELQGILGLGKVESYWLVHKERFQTITVAGKMRVVISSFEEWYDGQFHYKKVEGPEPGARWRESTISILEAADRLGVSDSSVYDMLKKGLFEAVQVDNRKRVVTKSFEAWFSAQTNYPVNKRKGGATYGVNR